MEFYNRIDRYEMLNLEKYCKRYENSGKFKWKKIAMGSLKEIRITKKRKPGIPNDVHIFQCID